MKQVKNWFLSWNILVLIELKPNLEKFQEKLSEVTFLINQNDIYRVSFQYKKAEVCSRKKSLEFNFSRNYW